MLSQWLTAIHSHPIAAGAEVGERIIPLEPVYVILNVAMSNAFNSEKLDYSNLNLQFPQEMKVGWVR